MAKTIEEKRAYAKAYWHANKDRLTKLNKDNNGQSKKRKRKRLEMVKWVENYKSKGCSICGNKHPAVLDLHHRDREQKKYTIAQLTRELSWDKMFVEIVKCDVLCSNCHRIHHYNERQLKKETVETDRVRARRSDCKINL